jgi:hypothetical protein
MLSTAQNGWHMACAPLLLAPGLARGLLPSKEEDLVRRLLVAIVAAATLSAPWAAGPPPALAQNQDGLVNVAIGDITIEDVNVGLAAQIVAAVCDVVDVGSVTVLAVQVDRSGVTSDTQCTVNAHDVTITQN